MHKYNTHTPKNPGYGRSVCLSSLHRMKRKRDPAPRHKSNVPVTTPHVKDWKLLGAGTFGVVTRVTLVGSYGNEESFAIKWIPVSEPPSLTRDKMEVEEP